MNARHAIAAGAVVAAGAFLLWRLRHAAPAAVAPAGALPQGWRAPDPATFPGIDASNSLSLPSLNLSFPLFASAPPRDNFTPANISTGAPQCGCSASVIDSADRFNAAITNAYRNTLDAIASIGTADYQPNIYLTTVTNAARSAVFAVQSLPARFASASFGAAGADYTNYRQ